MRARLVALALDYHKTVEGEYGCPGASCPGVQRVVELLEQDAAERALHSDTPDAHGSTPTRTAVHEEGFKSPVPQPLLDAEPEACVWTWDAEHDVFETACRKEAPQGLTPENVHVMTLCGFCGRPLRVAGREER